MNTHLGFFIVTFQQLSLRSQPLLFQNVSRCACAPRFGGATARGTETSHKRNAVTGKQHRIRDTSSFCLSTSICFWLMRILSGHNWQLYLPLKGFSCRVKSRNLQPDFFGPKFPHADLGFWHRRMLIRILLHSARGGQALHF